MANHPWPTLVEECRAMLEVSILVYGLSALRSLAREGVLSESHKNCVLTEPVTVKDILEVASENEDALKSHFSASDTKLYLAAFRDLEQSYMKEGKPQDKEHMNKLRGQQKIVVFDDKKSMRELVYNIGINSIDKRITLTFRGTASLRDIEMDLDEFMAEMPNPLDPNMTIGLQHGFYDYLFKRDEPNKPNKCEEILSQLGPLFQEYPDHHLYITGHSLGGALAILFAAFAVTDNELDIPTPASCLTFAAPKAGNRDFHNLFKSLEDDGLIRSLRVVNYHDFIPTMPALSFSCCRPQSVYYQAGPCLKIDKNGNHQVVAKDKVILRDGRRYPIGHHMGVLVTIPTLIRFKDQLLKFHSCSEYLRRFDLYAKQNGGVYLSELLGKSTNSDKVKASQGKAK